MNLPKIENIALDKIDLTDRLRPVDDEAAEKLALSMQETDAGQIIRRQINPIIVRQKDGRFLLVAGAHRVSAARKLGWDEIAAVVTEMSDVEAILSEIDENLYRKDLTGRSYFIRREEAATAHIFWWKTEPWQGLT